jgi:hypothetical protein
VERARNKEEARIKIENANANLLLISGNRIKWHEYKLRNSLELLAYSTSCKAVALVPKWRLWYYIPGYHFPDCVA